MPSTRRASSSTSSTRRSAWSRQRERSVIDLEQIGPGRYRGRFPAAQEGVYLVGMAQRADQRAGSQVAGLVVPYAQELRELGVDEAQLKGARGADRGRSAWPTPADAFLKGRHPRMKA